MKLNARFATSAAVAALASGFTWLVVSQAGGTSAAGRLDVYESVADAPHARVDAKATGGVAASIVTVGAFLETYFGDRWESVRASTKPPQQLLDQFIDAESIPQWAEVEQGMLKDLEDSRPSVDEQVREALKWDDKGTTSGDVDLTGPLLNPTAKVLSAQDIAVIRASLEKLDSDIHQLVLERNEAELAALRDEFARGRFEKAPFVKVMPERLSHGHVCALLCLAAGRWNMTIGFIQGDSAEYDAASALIAELRRVRMQTVQEFIAQAK